MRTVLLLAVMYQKKGKQVANNNSNYIYNHILYRGFGLKMKKKKRNFKPLRKNTNEHFYIVFIPLYHST